MIGYNCDAADRVHPCSVLGMLYVLEAISSVYGGRVSDAIARSTLVNFHQFGQMFRTGGPLGPA